MTSADGRHVPVLMREAIAALNPPRAAGISTALSARAVIRAQFWTFPGPACWR